MNLKRILCVIDALGPGGAERQMAGLSIMLKEQGYEVFVRYHEPKYFFSAQIKEAGIDVRCLGAGRSRFFKVLLYRNEIKRINPDVVISFLQPSNILTSIIRLTGLKFKLIVSERNTNIGKGLRDYIRFNLYRIADWIVPNSYSQEAFIKKEFSFLTSKVKTIVNFVDTDYFKPVNKKRGREILVVATTWIPKNTLGFIRALRILKDREVKCHVTWYGKVPDMIDYVNQCENLIKTLDVSDYIDLKDKTKDIKVEYNKTDYFCLPSFYEGTSNAICEALASGLPIICSDVCDNSKYVENEVNGFLFNPFDTENIANCIENVLALSDSDYRRYGKNSRDKALSVFAKKIFINNYIQIIDG